MERAGIRDADDKESSATLPVFMTRSLSPLQTQAKEGTEIHFRAINLITFRTFWQARRQRDLETAAAAAATTVAAGHKHATQSSAGQ